VPKGRAEDLLVDTAEPLHVPMCAAAAAGTRTYRGGGARPLCLGYLR
jgi:hypothetical protein